MDAATKSRRAEQTAQHLRISVVVPFKSASSESFHILIDRLSGLIDPAIDVIVCDGSISEVSLHDGLPVNFRRLPVDRAKFTFRNDKVNGLCTGVAAASAETVLICDDDCVATATKLISTLDDSELEQADLQPSVYKIRTYPCRLTFMEAISAARSLVSDGLLPGGDRSPALLARKSTLVDALLSIDGDYLFDDMVLEERLRASGYTVSTHERYSLTRIPLNRPLQWSVQQVRYAYEDLGAVGKSALCLAIPCVVIGMVLVSSSSATVAFTTLLTIACQVTGWLGHYRTSEFTRYPRCVILLAPVWLILRVLTVPIALCFLAAGGFPYGGRQVIRPRPVRLLGW